MECNLFNFHTKIVGSSCYQEVSIHTPLWTITVSDNPVFLFSFFINTPSNDNNGVIHVHPCNFTLVIKWRVTYILLFFRTFFWFNFILGWAGLTQTNHFEKTVLMCLMQVEETLFSENTFFVYTEHRWRLEISIDCSIS